MSNHGETQDDDFQKHLPGGKTTEDYLTEVLQATKTNANPVPGIDPDVVRYLRARQELDCDEVYPGIFIGDAPTAKNKKYLQTIGITHMLNAAEGTTFGYVNTSAKYYQDMPIRYLGLPLADLPCVDIAKYFYTAADFIDGALTSGGKVFVHCMLGVSRSATCVLAYLMIKKDMLAADAIKNVRENRPIRPNNGFLVQLARLDNHLRRERL